MIRTFAIGPLAKKCLFWAFGIGLSARNVGKSQGKCKNKALGKMAVFGPFSGPRMAISCQKSRPCFVNFPNVSRVFVYFLTSQHHTTHTPYHTHLSLFPLVFSVFPHAQHRTTYTLTTTHTHTHTCTPATDRDLESGLSKSHTRKNPRNMPEKGKVRGISGEGSFRNGRANRSSAAKWRMTNRTI